MADEEELVRMLTLRKELDPDAPDMIAFSDAERRATVPTVYEMLRAQERRQLELAVIDAAREWPRNYEREELLNDKMALVLFDAVQALGRVGYNHKFASISKEAHLTGKSRYLCEICDRNYGDPIHG